MRGIAFVRAEEVRRRPLRVAVSPAASLMMATRDAVGAQRSGTPEAWCESIRTHLTRADYETFAPLATSQLVLVPDAIMPAPAVPGLPLRDELERIVAVADAELAADIQRSAESGPTGDWRYAERHPERWVRRFVAALTRAWSGFQPVWQLAQEALAREIERVGVAAARDSQLELMDGLLPQRRRGRRRPIAPVEVERATDTRRSRGGGPGAAAHRPGADAFSILELFDGGQPRPRVSAR